MISIIVAIADNRAIGKNNDLLCRFPEDLKRFMQITSGHTVVMGKKTYESLPRRPLKNRRNVVITDIPGEEIPGCEMAYSINDALALCREEDESFIIGGASVYRQFLPLADRLYLTRIHRTFDADVFFPEIDFTQWILIQKEDFERDETNGFSYSNETYDRKR